MILEFMTQTWSSLCDARVVDEWAHETGSSKTKLELTRENTVPLEPPILSEPESDDL